MNDEARKMIAEIESSKSETYGTRPLPPNYIDPSQFKKCPLMAIGNALSDKVVNKAVRCTPGCAFFLEEFNECTFVVIAKKLGGK